MTLYGQNLVPNPSFELQRSCDGVNAQTAFSSDFYEPWQTFERERGYYINECLAYSQQLGCTHYPKDGKGYMTINYRVDEYVTAVTYLHTKLLEPLQAGETYYLEFFFDDALPNEMNSTYPVGAFISSSALDVSGTDKIDVKPQVINHTQAPFEWCTWNKVSGCFVAEGGEEYITVGMFFEPGIHLRGFMFVDDIQLVKLEDVAKVLGPDRNLCNDEPSNLELDATHPAATRYRWQDGDTNAIYSIKDTGTYWVQLENDCFSVRDTIRITRTEFRSEEENIRFLCDESSGIVLHGPSKADYYNWKTGSVEQDLMVIDTGLYILNTGLKNCFLSDSIRVLSASKSIANIGKDTVICDRAQTLTLTADNTNSDLLWNNGTTSDTFLVTQPGIYWVAVTNQCGTTYDTIRVEPDNCDCSYFLPNAFSPNGDGINDRYMVHSICKYTSSQLQQLQVFDRWGNLLFSSESSGASWDGYFDGKLANPGVYLIQTKWAEQLFDGSTVSKQQISDVLLFR